MRGVSLSFAGHDLLPTPGGALLWPARRALLVADLHFEKASWYAARGQFLPPYDSEATLTALTQLVTDAGVAELWCLGDSFHDSAGADRLPGRAREMLADLQRRVDWTWVVGNHDAALGAGIGGRVVDEVDVEGLLLRHEAQLGEPRPELSGHYHPKLRVRVRGHSIARRCFVQTPSKLVLPAFGALTGGLDAGDPAILAAVGRPATALVPTDGRLLRFPIAA